MTSNINIALLGSKFMGRAHSNAWLNVPKFFPVDPYPTMHTVVGRNATELHEFAERWGWHHHTTDWWAAVTSDDIGLVDIGTPNNVHAEEAIAALEAGKHVACEKPLAGTLADARAMAAAAVDAAGTTSVWFNYRRVPAVHWLTAWLPPGGWSHLCVPPTCRAGRPLTPCCGDSRAISPDQVRTAISMPTS